MEFVKRAAGMAIYRDDDLAPNEIFYSERCFSDVVRVGRDVDVEALAFDLSLTEDDRDMLAYLKVAP